MFRLRPSLEGTSLLPLNQRIAFGLFSLLCVVLGCRGFHRLFLRITRGREDADVRSGDVIRRAWYAIRTTLTQERVFRRRALLSVFHSFIFYAFVLYLLVNLLDAIEGFVSLRPLASPVARAIYGGLADSFSVLAIAGVLAFVVRRFMSGSRRDFSFNERTLLDRRIRQGYIQRDSLIVSAFIVFHVGSRMVGNAARVAAEGPQVAQPFSSLLAHAFPARDAEAWRIFGYWGALGSVLLFLVYFPYSKHVHLLMAPVKYFFRRNESSGQLPLVKIDLDAAEPQFGAARLADLSWPRLLDAYACIQCNRCQDVCPASQTGKALSPAALEINKRMVLNGIASGVSAFSLAGAAEFERRVSPGPDLLQAVISPESVWACTTCGACMEVCPTQDEQMLDIIDIRRNMVMQQGEFPAQLQNAFRGMERAGNPWAISREKRMDWAESLQVPTIGEIADPDVLYWVGCAASYDASAGKTARAVVQLLTEAKVKFAVLGKRESCTGDSARRAGNELLYQDLARTAIGILDEVRPKLVIASCPHCVNVIGTEYPQLGGNFEVMHHTEYLASMVEDGRLVPAPAKDSVITFHDPCYLGRHRGSYDQPRAVLHVLTDEYVELDRNRENAFCCGAGGAQFWKEEEPGNERISENRFREARLTLQSAKTEKVLAVGCPFCKSMLQSTPAAGNDPSIAIKDVAELLWEGVQRAKSSQAAPVHAQKGVPSDPGESVSVSLSVDRQQPSSGVAVSLPPVVEASEENASAKGALHSPAAGSEQRAGVESGVPSRTTERKKWVPKTASTTPAAASAAQESVTAATPESPPPAPPAERKRWVPKASATPEAPPITVEAAETRGDEAVQPITSEIADTSSGPARKKWQPGKKP